MRWKRKEKTGIESGSKRVVSKFLWKPTLDDDGYWRWLEFAMVEQEWQEICVDAGLCFMPIGKFKWWTLRVFGRGFECR